MNTLILFGIRNNYSITGRTLLLYQFTIKAIKLAVVIIMGHHFSQSRPALGSTHPPIQRALGVHSPGIKQHRHEADLSPPIGAEVKKTWT
jgi:hypothetical protein